MRDESTLGRPPARTGLIYALLVAAPAWAQSKAGPDRIGLTGGAHSVWAYRLIPHETDTSDSWHFAFLKESLAGPLTWRRPLGLQPVRGEIERSCMLGEWLHVFFEDGSHWAYGPDRSRLERQLPLPVVPIALAADETAGTLLALVTKQVGLAVLRQAPEPLLSPSSTPDDTGKGDESADSTVETEAVAPPSWSSADYVLVRMENGKWVPDVGVPELTKRPERAWITVSSSLVELLYEPDKAAGDVLEQTFDRAAVQWHGPQSLRRHVAGRLRAVLGTDAGTVLIVSNAKGGAIIPVRRDGDEWTPGDALSGSSDELTPSEPAAFGHLGDDIVAAWFAGDGALRWARWPREGGQALAKESTLDALIPRQSPEHFKRQAMIVGYALLFTTVFIVYRRRRQSMFIGVALPPKLRLAPFSRRLAAFLVDTIIFMPATVYLFQPWMRHLNQQFDLQQQLAMLDVAAFREFTWRWLIGLAAFITYMTVFETWWAASPGKRLLGCRVVDESGKNPRFRRVLIRNILRTVELFPNLILLWTLVFVFMTRNRQRLGDLMAETIVVVSPPKKPSL